MLELIISDVEIIVNYERCNVCKRNIHIFKMRTIHLCIDILPKEGEMLLVNLL